MPYVDNDLTGMVDLSTYCNASCPQCHRTDQEDISKKNYWLPLVQWSFETFKRRFPKQSLYRYRQIICCGTWGDPMMNKDIMKIIKYVLSSNNKTVVIINTNASLRDETWWWELGMISYKHMHRLQIIFDVDGITQEQHSTYRVGTELDKVLAHMKAFAESGSVTKCFTIVFQHNQDDVEKIGKLAKANGATHMYIQPSNRFDKNPEQFRYIQEGKLRHLKPSTKYTEFEAISL